MQPKSEFKTVEFFRKIRDKQAIMLTGKSHEEIMAFFSSFAQDHKPNQTFQSPSYEKTMAGAK